MELYNFVPMMYTAQNNRCVGVRLADCLQYQHWKDRVKRKYCKCVSVLTEIYTETLERMLAVLRELREVISENLCYINMFCLVYII